MKLFRKIKETLKETRHYSWDSLTKDVICLGSWNVIDISNDKELIQRLWDNHISKISHLNYYLSEQTIECVVKTPRGVNFLKWTMYGGEPIWFEYVLNISHTGYDIHYPQDFICCPELRNWLIENGKRFTEMYKRDKNL